MDDMEPFMNNDIFNVRDISEIEGKVSVSQNCIIMYLLTRNN